MPMQKYIKLRMYLTKAGIKQSEAAREIGISHATMSNRLCGKSPFTMTEAEKLCKLLEIPAEDFYEVFMKGKAKGREIELPQMNGGRTARIG